VGDRGDAAGGAVTRPGQEPFSEGSGFDILRSPSTAKPLKEEGDRSLLAPVTTSPVLTQVPRQRSSSWSGGGTGGAWHPSRAGAVAG